jgi:hypothetical protein
MRKLIEIVVALILVGTTLAFGGVEPIAYSAACAGLFLALLLVMLRQTWQGEIHIPVSIWPVLFALWVLLQVIPLPASLVASLSPVRFQSGAIATFPRAPVAWETISIYPHDTLVALLKYLSYLSAFILAAYVFDSRRGKSTLIRALILLGCFEACYGIVQYLTGWQKIFTYTKRFDLGSATGTYINRNHFAGLMELTMPLVLAAGFYSYEIWSGRRRGTRNTHSAAVRSEFAFKGLFYLFVFLLMALALLASSSRGGILAAMLSTLFVVLLAQIRTRKKSLTVAAVLFLFCIMGYSLWVGLDPVLVRFERLRDPSSLTMEGRIPIWKDGLQLIRDYPVTGTGLGTFQVAFRGYQTTLLDKYVDHAHNDYLEFTADTGFVGSALLFGPILYLFVRMIISFLDDQRLFRRSVTLGCIGAIMAILIHSVADFNLQITANALVFAVVLGIGYKATRYERMKEEKTGPTRDNSEAGLQVPG